MLTSVSISKPVTTFAHDLWLDHIKAQDVVVDATCGNGRDTLFLAGETPCDRVYALDIQADAIISTQNRLQRLLANDRLQKVLLFQQCHSVFPSEIQIKEVALVVYNLGYLPGGIKSMTTKLETTLRSIENAQNLLKNAGLISIACYPGHPEGKIEEEALLRYAEALNPSNWECFHFRDPERKSPPSLLVIKNISF